MKWDKLLLIGNLEGSTADQITQIGYVNLFEEDDGLDRLPSVHLLVPLHDALRWTGRRHVWDLVRSGMG
jgi:hypothetical protein